MRLMLLLQDCAPRVLSAFHNEHVPALAGWLRPEREVCQQISCLSLARQRNQQWTRLQIQLVSAQEDYRSDKHPGDELMYRQRLWKSLIRTCASSGMRTGTPPAARREEYQTRF